MGGDRTKTPNEPLSLWNAALYPAELVKRQEFNRLENASLPQIVPNVHFFSPPCDQSVTGSGTKGTCKICSTTWAGMGHPGAVCVCAGAHDRDFAMRDYWD